MQYFSPTNLKTPMGTTCDTRGRRGPRAQAVGWEQAVNPRLRQFSDFPRAFPRDAALWLHSQARTFPLLPSFCRWPSQDLQKGEGCSEHPRPAAEGRTDIGSALTPSSCGTLPNNAPRRGTPCSPGTHPSFSQGMQQACASPRSLLPALRAPAIPSPAAKRLQELEPLRMETPDGVR